MGSHAVTVYEKGAEVVRMYESLLGKAGFRAPPCLPITPGCCMMERYRQRAILREDTNCNAALPRSR